MFTTNRAERFPAAPRSGTTGREAEEPRRSVAKGMRTAMMSLCALALCSACWCQEPAAPAVDRNDPAAVARAYLQALSSGDAEAAAALVLDKGGARDALVQFSRELATEGRGIGFDFQAMLAELQLVPAKSGRQYEVAGQEGGDTQVTIDVQEAKPRRAKLVLVKDAEGKWCVDFEDSAMKTSGAERSFVIWQAQMRSQAQVQSARVSDEPRGPDYWQRRNAIQQMASRLTEMAEKHGRLPPADTWTDEMAKYLMDPSATAHPEGLGPKFGYALNAAVAGQPLPDDWTLRQSMVVVYETQDPAPNQSGDPDEALDALPEGSEGLLVGFADGNATQVPAEMSVAAVVQSWRMYETCQQRVSVLVHGLLEYAREHDGKLPEADSWCDDIAPYIEPSHMGPDAFVCPGALDLEYGYAINADLAGKDIRLLRGHNQYVLLLPAEEGVRNESLKLPDKVKLGRHMPRWGEGRRLGVNIGLLNGSMMEISEEQPYPKPPQ